jgi:hypothetical protein
LEEENDYFFWFLIFVITLGTIRELSQRSSFWSDKSISR